MPETTLTVLYDNSSLHPELRSGYGFSCLVETPETTVLFDTGESGAHLLHNFQQLDKQAKQVDTVVISHLHWDHVDGLDYMLQLNNEASVYVPEKNHPSLDSLEEFAPVIASEPAQVEHGIFISGILGSSPSEQSLIVQTREGILLVTGCAHPGIETILDNVVTHFPYEEILLILGGFHLYGSDQQEIQQVVDKFRTHGIRQVAPAHCTGSEAITLLRKEYGEHFVTTGAGTTLRFPSRELK